MWLGACVPVLRMQGLGPYSVSKTALFGLTKVLAKELGSDNITVNCLAPGIVQTKFSAAVSMKSVMPTRTVSLIQAEGRGLFLRARINDTSPGHARLVVFQTYN